MRSGERICLGLLMSLLLVGSLLLPHDARAQAGVLPAAERPVLKPFPEEVDPGADLFLPRLPIDFSDGTVE